MRVALSRFTSANHSIIKHSSTLIGSTAVGSILGFVYWWVAARFFSPAALGLASAGVSAMTFLASVSILGLNTLLISEISRDRAATPRLIGTAVWVTASIGALLGCGFALLSPLLIADLAPFSEHWIGPVLFGLAVGLSATSIILDQATIGLLRGELQLERNTFFAITKLLLVIGAAYLFAQEAGIGLFGTWVIASVLSILLIGWRLARIPELPKKLRAYAPDLGMIQRLGPSALSHYALNLTLQAPRLLLPLLVTAIFSAEVNAHFYVALMMANFVFVGPISLTSVLHAVGIANATQLTARLRSSLMMSLAIGVLANLVVQPGAELILHIFGPTYGDAAHSLRLLTLAVFPLTIRYHYVSLARIESRTGPATLILLVGAGLELLFAAIGASIGGVTGLSLGWLLALCCHALLLSPPVYRVATRNQAIATPASSRS